MPRSSVHLIAALCATVILASPAAAAEPDYGDLGGGPGRSAIDQYREAVPSGGGPAKVSQSERNRLADGDKASRGYVGTLIGAVPTGIEGVDTPPGTSSEAKSSDRASDREPASRSTVEAGVAPDGDSSLGPVPLWLAIAVTAVVAVAAAVVRWRRTA